MALDNRFELLAHVVEIANSSVDVEERLDNILGALNRFFHARGVVLYMQDQAGSSLLPAHFWPREQDQNQPALEQGQGLIGSCAITRAPQVVAIDGSTGDPGLDHHGKPGDLAAIWPVMDDHLLYAVMLLILPQVDTLADDDRRLLDMVSRELGGTIRNFRLYFEAKKRIAELNVLSDLGRAAISTIEMDELLDTVAGICAKLLGARGGLVHVTPTRNHGGGLRAVNGTVPPECLEEDACQRFCLAQKDQKDSGRAQVCNQVGKGGEPGRGLCMRLAFKGDYDGHLCVFDKVVQETGMAETGFSAEDRNLLTTMASMVSSALENALTFQKVEDLAERNEEMVGALATLFEISTVLMTTVDFKETVQIILHAVTHPAGLDHDRVVLFLLDEQKGVLRAVADMAKNSLWGPTRELTDTLLDLKNQLPLERELISPEMENLEVELEPSQSVLARTAIEKRAQQVDDPSQDPNGASPFLKAFGNHPFVTVPMFAKGKVVGVLAVNNANSKRVFNDRDLKFLAMLANLGGLSVENSRLYQNLENANRELAHMRSRLLEADKLAALGEIAAGVAHEIRNPLVSIGGFTRRIRKKVGDDSDIRPYLDVIIEEVTRLEQTLNEMLDFSTDSRNLFDEYELNQVMEDSLELLKRELKEANVNVNRVYGQGLPRIYCDERQIKHVFFNLILNAIQAMEPGGGTLTVRSYTVMREGKQFVAGEVADTGEGIPMEVMHDIFNPFFTTKDSGSGMGLSIVHKIVSRHFGEVEVHSGHETGAAFVVTLPAAEEGRAYYLK